MQWRFAGGSDIQKPEHVSQPLDDRWILHKRTILGKMIGLVDELCLGDSCYIVADRCNCSAALMKKVLKQGNHLITRAKSNCSARFLPPKRSGKPRRGKPQKYGRRVKLSNLFRSTK